MRRILLVLAVLAGGLLATPAAATPQRPSAAAVSAAMTARMEAAGWTTDLTALASMQATGGQWAGYKGWYNNANGRFYYMKARVAVEWQGGEWRPYFLGSCTRKYGNLEVAQRCNYGGLFHALVSPQGVTVNSVGSRLISFNCINVTPPQVGQWRAYGSTYPWVMSFLEDYHVRFVTEACAHVHLTQEYDVGSYMVRPATGSVIEHEWTGALGWTQTQW